MVVLMLNSRGYQTINIHIYIYCGAHAIATVVGLLDSEFSHADHYHLTDRTDCRSTRDRVQDLPATDNTSHPTSVHA